MEAEVGGRQGMRVRERIRVRRSRGGAWVEAESRAMRSGDGAERAGLDGPVLRADEIAGSDGVPACGRPPVGRQMNSLGAF